MKKYLLKSTRAILRRARPETRINFALSILQEEMQTQEATENWQLLNRIFQRFGKSYPLQPSREAVRTYGFFKILSDLKEVPGDIVECGVGRGRYLAVFAYANAFFQLKRKVYGFDTFTGFPDASLQDLGTRVTQLGTIGGWGDNSPDIVRCAIETDRNAPDSVFKTDLDSTVITVAGLFADTLPENLPGKIAFLHADADLYESTRDILTHALPRMASGGIIVFDELHETEKWPGVAKAVEEICTPQKLSPCWMEEMHRYVIYIP